MRKALRIKVSIAGASSQGCKRLVLSGHLTLRKAHAVLRQELGAPAECRYCFQQDGRIFANPALHRDYVEDDATYNLNHCLCLPGHTLEYVLGGLRLSIELEAIERWPPDGAAPSAKGRRKAVASRPH